MSQIELKRYKIKNGETIQVRTAFTKDANKVLKFNKAIISNSPYLLTTEEEFKITIEQQKDFLKQMLNDEGKLAILAEYQGEIIGFLDFHNGNKKRVQHHGSFGMSVAAEFRNQGIGKALLTELINWAKENSLIEKVSLEVFADNTNAISLYEKAGFTKEGRKLAAIKVDSGKYFDLILMAYFTKHKNITRN
ncbi:GNAT family N-acetyltransferase [Pseudalkalibacillus salsuginis]|uniref:GNAT family N-acetyltransferase n=1 Tax=Pseudalkalibacillus salsuginis TaxID=2910972 RepID=UPI001F1E5E06|nr:GNAT family N-acetyltransferase [Pseudalkalibacillus salsuginis]MCF6409111.1 GNAT family N-acetyltransferase [Pseudalkalibacillus salsuginis]